MSRANGGRPGACSQWHFWGGQWEEVTIELSSEQQEPTSINKDMVSRHSRWGRKPGIGTGSKGNAWSRTEAKRWKHLKRSSSWMTFFLFVWNKKSWNLSNVIMAADSHKKSNKTSLIGLQVQSVLHGCWRGDKKPRGHQGDYTAQEKRAGLRVHGPVQRLR